MSHPTSACPEAARLYQLVLDISALHNNTPAVLRMPAITAEHHQENWQVAWSLYQCHVHNCTVCQEAIHDSV